ncbi:hypothetical protein GCM10009745_67500 [Kribbella yunnanensis]|uniref:DUF2127 domain-containing protein n=1 Tax=Kribbella yunnanensis TaxID=190194 RepID=A0ABP4UTQ6_9ACTN
MTETRWTPRLQVLVGVCSIVFTIGTALQNFWIVNHETLVRMMVLAGRSEADAEAGAPGFLIGFRVVGCLYILGNAAGILALRKQKQAWLFWLMIAVNLTQAVGVFAVPPEMFEASTDRLGPVGALPSLVTDGGAAVLTLVLLGFLIRSRRPWAQRRVASAA